MSTKRMHVLQRPFKTLFDKRQLKAYQIKTQKMTKNVKKCTTLAARLNHLKFNHLNY